MIVDFDYYHYIAVTQLNMSVAEFWNATPRVINTLFDLHCKFNNFKFASDEDNKIHCIDEIPFL